MHRAIFNLRTLGGLVLFAALGCGNSGPARYELQGEVTFRNAPLPAGTIVFDPDTEKSNEGPQGFGHIKQGKYDTRDQGRPVVQGPHLVRITGYDGVPGPEMPQGKMLFPPYTTTVDIDPAQPTYDFTVPTPGAK